MPPWLISVPRPGTTVVEKPFEVITRTGRSTGSRFQRRVLPRLVFAGEDIDRNHRSSRPILTDYLGEPALRAEGQHYARRADVQLDNTLCPPCAKSKDANCLQERLPVSQCTGFPSASILCTSPRFRSRMPASTLLMSPTTTQIK